jgi:MFS family permease
MNRRMATVGVAYAFLVTMIGTTMPTPLYPIYEQRFGFAALTVTIVYAVYGIGVLGTLLLVGPLSDRLGRRPLLLPGLGFAAASSVVFILAHGLPALFIGRVLSGISAGLFTGTATAALLDLASDSGKQRATLVATVVNMGGLGLGPLLAGILAELAPDPLRLPYAVHLALLVPAAAVIFLMPEPHPAEPLPHARRAPAINLHIPAEVRSTFIRAATAAFAAFATLGLFSAIAPVFLGKLLGLPNHALSGAVVFTLFAASLGGQLSLSRFSAQGALQAGCGFMIAGLAAIAAGLAANSLLLLLLGAAVAGFGTGPSFRAGLSALNAQTPPAKRGEVNSAFFLVAYVALSVPIIGVGVANNAFGLRAAGLVFIGCVALLALLVLLSLRGAGELSSAPPEQSPDTLHSAATADSTGNR